jgi:CheY-like chemotaxis protein
MIENMSAEKEEPLRGIRVLLVDDSELSVRLIERPLRQWGVHLTIAGDGLEAVHRASAGDFDLVLMDIHLPGMDGITAAGEIRGFRQRLPIIAMTAEDEVPSVFFAHVRKPVQTADLYEKMKEALKHGMQL